MMAVTGRRNRYGVHLLYIDTNIIRMLEGMSRAIDRYNKTYK